MATQTSRYINSFMDGRKVSGKSNGQCGRIDRWKKEGWAEDWIDGWVDRCMDKWIMNEWMNE